MRTHIFNTVGIIDFTCDLLLGCTKTDFRTIGPNGPDIAHLGILPQFDQNPFRVIEMLSFSCSVLLLVKADGDHFAVPNC